jgi:molybdate transport system ATP-binding protein
MLNVQISKRLQAPDSPAFSLHVNEQFPPGFTVLFGPSGAGKSTLLDCVAGLLVPDEGHISLDGEVFFDRVEKVSLPASRRRIAYVFQSLALFPHLSAEENVAYGLSEASASERSERIAGILGAFHIEGMRKRKPRELSGGEKQRVALARSLVTQPRVLLLDEPLTGLDSGLRQSILEDLREWNAAKRIPILYVTHNREEVDAIGERVVALVDGRVRETGLPRNVLDAPRAATLAQAAGFENLLSARVTEYRENDGVMHVELDAAGCGLEVPLSSVRLGEMVQVAIRAGDILLAAEPPRALSARNVFEGSVESLETRGALVVVEVKAGVRFTVHVTPGAARALQLAAGRRVWLVLKTHSCHVVTQR